MYKRGKKTDSKKERVLIPIILLFPRPAFRSKSFLVHLPLANICRDVVRHQNDQMHKREPVNNKKAVSACWQTKGNLQLTFLAAM